jgi:phosphatidate cytidylyltransferase
MSHPDTSGWPEPDDRRERWQAGTAENAPRRAGRHIALDREDDGPEGYRPAPAPTDPGRVGRRRAEDRDDPHGPSNGGPARVPADQGPGERPEQPARPGPAEPAPGNAGQPAPAPGNAGQPAPAAEPEVAAQPKKSRAGRNLPAAIGVGVTLGGIVIASLFLWRPAFLGVVTLAVGVGIWEMTRAVAQKGPRAPLLPLLAGAVVMEALAWNDGAEALILGLVLTVVAAMVWRLADGAAGYQRDITATALIAVYVPFLAGFAVLLAKPDDGAWRVIVTLAAVVLSDTGGYVAGVFFGKHRMAPMVSPKKSWEGFAGSVISAAVGSAVLFYLVMDDLTWWQGLVFGAGVSAACVLGDLGESLMKRDLGVKDMSNLLPGHGGLMDRLDSILFAAPTAFLLLLAFSSTTG